jgi:hypothetical protein
MNFKTMLRKWHTWLGLLILVPSLILSVTGIYLVEFSGQKNALVAATACEDGAWVAITSDGIIGSALDVQRVPFDLSSVSAISCTSTHIDMALTYGPIVSTSRQHARWQFTPRPFDGAIRTLQRTSSHLVVTTYTGLWMYRQQEWLPIQQFEPTFAQKVHAFHAGWFNGQSFGKLWSFTGVAWVILAISGLWIFIRMLKNLYKK